MKVAVIPARGGSKRIPGKNIRDFCGQPMIAYPIRAAQAAGLFDRIIVSTDSAPIAEVARQCGAEVPFMRPPDLADDYATTDSVFLHAIETLEAASGPIDYATCIYPTAPFVQPQYLREGLDILIAHSATSAFTVTTYGYPIHRALRIGTAGRLEMMWPENRLVRSQDLPQAYHDAGQFYWVSAPKYKHQRHLFSDDAVPIVLPNWLVHDIDTPDDWRRAEQIFRIGLAPS
jgi:N-acylneuraminate cytidylyltransferase